jgi:hypothetical protein
MVCINCSIEASQRGEEPPVLADVELNDDGLYEGTCPNGHNVASAYQNLKYEVLFESGAVALLWGFNREAFSSFATALERFYEFATEVYLTALNVPPEKFEAAWSAVAAASERQLGAFLFLYLARYKNEFPFPPDWKKMSTRRNEVIHRGHIPTADEARAFARDVFEIIETVTVQLLNESEAPLFQVHARFVGENYAKARARGHTQIQTAGMNMMVSPTEKRASPRDFETVLASLRGRLSVYGLSPARRPIVR